MKPLSDRDLLIIKLRDKERMIFRLIGLKIGTSDKYAHLLYRSSKRRKVWYQFHGNKEYLGLSTRAENVCRNMNLSTKKKIKEAIENGALHPKSRMPGYEYAIRNYGWNTHLEIHRWLGIPEPKRKSPRHIKCPKCGYQIE